MQYIFKVPITSLDGVCIFTFNQADLNHVEYHGAYSTGGEYTSDFKAAIHTNDGHNFYIISAALTDSKGVVHQLIIPQSYEDNFNCNASHNNGQRDDVQGTFKDLITPIEMAFKELCSVFEGKIRPGHDAIDALCSPGRITGGGADIIASQEDIQDTLTASGSNIVFEYVP